MIELKMLHKFNGKHTILISDINECTDRNICQGSGTCVNTWGGYYCIGSVFRCKYM